MGRVKKDEIGAKGRRKPKKKNANKASNSNMSSARRLSRMGKEQKKGLRGAAGAFITRNQALKRLGSVCIILCSLYPAQCELIAVYQAQHLVLVTCALFFLPNK